tara:strand:- start:67 stop:306 length:240 start_codon:yes stop_codon:yes gene_type:complete
MNYVFLIIINHFDLHIIESLFKKNKIHFIVKSTYDSSVMAGWMQPASSFNEKVLFVDKNQLNQAKKVLRQYKTDYNKTD